MEGRWARFALVCLIAAAFCHRTANTSPASELSSQPAGFSSRSGLKGDGQAPSSELESAASSSVKTRQPSQLRSQRSGKLTPGPASTLLPARESGRDVTAAPTPRRQNPRDKPPGTFGTADREGKKSRRQNDGRDPTTLQSRGKEDKGSKGHEESGFSSASARASSPSAGSAQRPGAPANGAGPLGGKAGSVYWPWGPQDTGRGKDGALSQATKQNASSGASHPNSGSPTRSPDGIFWPWGPNTGAKNASWPRSRNASLGSLRTTVPEGGASSSGKRHNSEPGGSPRIPWPWGPGSADRRRSNSSVGTRPLPPGGDPLLRSATQLPPGASLSSLEVALASDLTSTPHVHHAHVPELDEARLSDSSVAVAREEAMYFISRLFQRYGKKDSTFGSLRRSDLMAMLDNMGFNAVLEKKLETSRPRSGSGGPSLYRPGGETKGVAQGLHQEHSHCLNTDQLLSAFHFEQTDEVDYQSFLFLCPALVYQVDSQCCIRHAHPVEYVQTADQSGNASHAQETPATGSAGWKQWLSALGSVLVVSLAGLVSVAIVQGAQSHVHSLLPFLVALAVGALSGDALLHLLPHILSTGHSEPAEGEAGGHREGVWKGLAALTGLLSFWLMESLLRLLQSCRKPRRSSGKRLALVKSVESGGSPGTVVEGEDKEVEAMLKRKTPGSDLQPMETLSAAESGDLRPEANGEGHHEHAHGHAHAVPESMTAVLSMVVLGDGIHNLLDGMAIGAAFAAGVTSGLSTALAVMCHELPHEIGDFAMLLRAGMPVRRALLFNCVSSVLCLMGCAVGLLIGHVASLTSWLLAAVAGLFLYIALVTMLPQLRQESGSDGGRAFVLQLGGILLGSGIMLLIAVFEEELKSLLEV